MGKTTGSQSFIKNFFVLGFGSFIYLIIGLIGTPIITRLVDPAEYGYMSMFTVYSNIGLMFCGLGLDQTLVRYFYHRDDLDYKRTILFECLSAPTILCVVLGLLILPAALFTNTMGWTSQPISELVLLEINVFLLVVHRYAILLLRLRYHTKQYSTINIIQKATYLIIAVALVVWLKDYYFYILAVSTILSTLIATVCAMLLEKEVWDFRALSRENWIPQKELLSYSIPIMFSSGITMIFNALDKLFLNHFCTLTDVGVYTSAMNLMAVFTIVRTTFNALWLPTAVEHYEKNPDDKAFYQRGNAFIVVLMISFGAGVILCKDLFVMLLGNKYQEAAQIIPFLMFEPIMYTISETTATGIVVQKKSKYQMLIAGVSCITNFFGNWLLTPLMGARGAALSTGVSYIVFFAMRTVLANKVFYVDYHLKKFMLVSLTLLLFAYYGSAHFFSLIQVLMCAVVLLVTLFCYRQYLSDAVSCAGSMLKAFQSKRK